MPSTRDELIDIIQGTADEVCRQIAGMTDDELHIAEAVINQSYIARFRELRLLFRWVISRRRVDAA